MKRRLLGRASGAISRQRVYRFEEGLEVDEIDHYEVSRRRVFFDEVTAITFHEQMGWVVAVLLGLPALGMFTFAIVFAVADEMTAAGICAAIGALLAIPALVKLVVRVRVVTIFGKRSKAVMKFSFRHARARRIYEELVEEVRAKQEAVARQLGVSAPVPQEQFPLPEEPR